MMHVYRGGSVRDHLLASYRNSFAAVVLRQLQDKGFRGGMQAGRRAPVVLLTHGGFPAIIKCKRRCVCMHTRAGKRKWVSTASIFEAFLLSSARDLCSGPAAEISR